MVDVAGCPLFRRHERQRADDLARGRHFGVGRCWAGGRRLTRVAKDFRIGAELYGELTLTGDDISWMVVGPTVSLTSGRMWGAATFGVGVLGVRDAGRITFGVAL